MRSRRTGQSKVRSMEPMWRGRMGKEDRLEKAAEGEKTNVGRIMAYTQ